MKCYLSGPMTGYPGFNFAAFEHAANRLRSFGVDVLSAHNVDHGEAEPGGLPWATYLREDLAALVTCDAIILLRGWPSSKGARLELATALALDMPVFLWDDTHPAGGGALVDMNNGHWSDFQRAGCDPGPLVEALRARSLAVHR